METYFLSRDNQTIVLKFPPNRVKINFETTIDGMYLPFAEYNYCFVYDARMRGKRKEDFIVSFYSLSKRMLDTYENKLFLGDKLSNEKVKEQCRHLCSLLFV